MNSGHTIKPFLGRDAIQECTVSLRQVVLFLEGLMHQLYQLGLVSLHVWLLPLILYTNCQLSELIIRLRGRA